MSDILVIEEAGVPKKEKKGHVVNAWFEVRKNLLEFGKLI